MAITERVARRILDEYLYAPESGITGLKREVVQPAPRRRNVATTTETIEVPAALTLEGMRMVFEHLQENTDELEAPNIPTFSTDDLNGYSVPLSERQAIREALAWNQHDPRLIKTARQREAMTLYGQMLTEGVGCITNDNLEQLRDVVMMFPVVNGAWMTPEEQKAVMEAILSGDRETVRAVSHTVTIRRQQRRERRLQNG